MLRGDTGEDQVGSTGCEGEEDYVGIYRGEFLIARVGSTRI